MKRTFHIAEHNIMRPAVSMLLMTAAVFATTGCKDTFDIFGGSSHDGDTNTATFEIQVSPSTVAERTRAAGNDIAWDDETVKHIWLGVFDNKDGKLIGAEEWIVKDGNWTPKKGNDDDHAPALEEKVRVSVMYPDNNPPKVMVVGVANYEGIKAYKRKGTAWDTEEYDMGALLGEVKEWKDYLAIAIDTESAEERARINGCRIMSNIVSFSEKDTHDNYTVDVNGDDASVNEKSCSSKDNYIFSDLNAYSTSPIKGNLHLRRIIAHNIVKINPDSEKVRIENVRYKVFNVPTRTYVQERTTETDFFISNATEQTAESWFNISPNAADYFTEDNAPYYMELEMGNADSSNEGYSFEFSQYDNKHWGLKDSKSCEAYTDREKKHSGTDIYSSICPSPEIWYNNYASYFQIYATVTDLTSNITADVTYTIHEGYANDADLSNLTTVKSGEANYGKRCRDFMCVRNTKYTYNVNINGINSFTVDVESENPAISGLAKCVTKEFKADGSNMTMATIQLTDAQRKSLVWRIYTPATGGSDAGFADFGTFDSSMFTDMADISSDWKGTEKYEKKANADNISNDFYKSIKFYDESGNNPIGATGSIQDFISYQGNDESLKTYTVKIENNYNYSCTYDMRDNYARFLYCYPQDGEYSDEAGLRTYQPLIVIKQYPSLPKSTTPSIMEESFKFTNSISTYNEEVGEVAIANYVNSVTVILNEKSVGQEDGKEDETTYYISINNGAKIKAEIKTENSKTLLTVPITTRLEAGKYTLKLSAEHVDYEPSAESEPVDFYVYPTTMTWNAKDMSKPTTGESSTFYTNSDKAPYCGLTLGSGITTASSGSGNNTRYYINTEGSWAPGNSNGRYIEFTALYDGLITVVVSSSNSNSEDLNRLVKVYDDEGKEIGSEIGGAISSSSFTRTFNVHKGKVQICSSSSTLLFYSITFEYRNYWDFSSNAWADVITQLLTANNDVDIPMEIDGLTLIGPKLKTANNNTYIQLNGEGNYAENCFKFNAKVSGTLTLNASNTGSSERYVGIQVGNKADKISTPLESTTKTKLTFKVEITEPTDVYIYSEQGNGGGLRFFDIDYKPTY